MAENGRKKTKFVWDDVKLKVAEAIAKGDRSLNEILTECGVSERTVYRWKKHPEFQRKVDEIIQDIDIAQKAERIKIAKKVIKQKLEHDKNKLSNKDILDWLKYVGEEVGDYEPKQHIKITGEQEHEVKHTISADPELRDLANQLLKRLAVGNTGRLCVSGKQEKVDPS